MHYPSTVHISDVGETIANYVNRHAMQRLRDRREEARSIGRTMSDNSAERVQPE